ncbi:glycosyltransferase family A protein [Pseudomonas sp. WHRI 8519]|uniref:glycosyltransferase family 2 protein n=1 Tax=Pseudomonas sp. WHRI 8519 TaxID=3162567 RepID=UPI0032F06B47
MKHITSGNKAFLQKRYNTALNHYKAASRVIDAQLLSYNIFKCQESLSSHKGSITPAWSHAYFDSRGLATKKSDKKYIAGIASMPSRIPTLEKVIQDILPQVDEIHIFLNNYTTVPAFLYKDKIHIYRSQEHGDQRDNGKFFGLNHVDNDSYYFTLDDDIRYPQGYFNLLAQKLSDNSNNVAVGIHGVIYAPMPKSFFERITFNFERELAWDTPVSVLGTGTTGFYTGKIKPPFSHFTATGMADLYFGSYLKQKNIPALCIRRPQDWLKEYERDDRSDTIYHETKSSSTPYDNYLVKNSPWGVNLIQEAVEHANIALQPPASDFLHFISKLPLTHVTNKHIHNPHSDFFKCAGIFPHSDEVYLKHAATLARWVISSEPELPEPSWLIANSLIRGDGSEIEHPTFDREVAAWNLSALKSYTLESQNPEIVLTLEVVELLLSQDVYGKNFERVLRASLKTGQSNLIVPCVSDKILYDLDHDLIHNLLKAAIDENSESRHRLLKCSLAITSPSHTTAFLKALYDSLENSDDNEQSLLHVINGKYKTKNKVKHLTEVLRVALQHGTRILPTKRFAVLQDPSIEIGVKRIILDALMTENSLNQQKPVELLIKSLDIYQFSESEHALRIAELRRQSKPNGQHLITALNVYFKSCGMTQITRHAKKGSFFTGIKSASKHYYSENHGLCSVVIAAYNAEKTLQYAYDSICNQTYPNIEIFIIDDCSEIPVENYLALNPTIKTTVIRNLKNEGPYGCRNVALNQISGAYYVIQDADDWAHPQKLELQIDSIQSPELVCSYARHVRITSEGALKLENHGEFIGHGPMTSLFKSRIFKDIGEFDAVATRGDMEFKARIKRFYGTDAIFEDKRLMLLSLDWHSNSKQKTSSLNKAYKLSHYKASYSRWHALLPFTRTV